MESTSRTSVEETVAVPTCYKIRFKESLQHSWWFTSVLTVPVIAVTLGGLLFTKDGTDAAAYVESFYVSWNQGDKAVVVGAVSVILALIVYCQRLFSTGSALQETEVSLTISPLGIQRSKKIFTTHNTRRQKKTIQSYPLIPMDIVKDCMLLEHVGTFSVTTHVMIRTNEGSAEEGKSGKGLVTAFPDAILTFDQCHDLVQQIQKTLKELR